MIKTSKIILVGFSKYVYRRVGCFVVNFSSLGILTRGEVDPQRIVTYRPRGMKCS